VKKNPGRREARVGIKGQPPLWTSAGSTAKGRLLDPNKVATVKRDEEVMQAQEHN